MNEWAYQPTQIDPALRVLLTLLGDALPDSPLVSALEVEVERVQNQHDQAIDRERTKAGEDAAVTRKAIGETKRVEADRDAVVARCEAAEAKLQELADNALNELADRYRSKPLPPDTDALLTWISRQLGPALRGAA